MITALIAMALSAAAQEPAAEPAPAKIVVRARRRKCLVEVDQRTLSGTEFEEQAGRWVGKPVRVIAAERSDIKCLAKVAFRLAERGVRLIQFVDPADEPAGPLADR